MGDLLGVAFVLLVGSGLIWLISRKERQNPCARPLQTKVVVGDVAVAETAASEGPVPFGYKTSWFAFRCDDPEWVIASLSPLSRQSCDWGNGLALSHGESDRVFVSPCLDGFVLVIGDVPFYRLEDLAQDFEEVQAFFSYRTSDCYSWTKYVRGELIRAYTCLDNIVDEDFGELTPEELALGFERFSPDGPVWPDEEDVLAIAAAWGIDPKFEHKTYPPNTGWLCALYGAEKGVM